MKNIAIDVETYQADPNKKLKAVGSYRYLEGAEIMLLGWAGETGPVVQRDLTAGDSLDQFLALIEDTDVVFWAHNAMFDRVAINHLLDRRGYPPLPIERWRCSMVQAYTCGLAGSLEEIGRILDIPLDLRKKDGNKLKNLFCSPTPKGVRRSPLTHPTEWEEFKDYHKNDILALREIMRRLPGWVYPGMESELKLWQLDQASNDRGLPIDAELAQKAHSLTVKFSAELSSEALATVNPEAWAKLAQEDTATKGPQILRQRDALLSWIREQGVAAADLTKASVTKLLQRQDLPPDVRTILGLRQKAAKTSTAKFKRVLASLCDDGRLHGAIQFYGAMRTGRMAGRIFQPQNLPSRGLLPAQLCVDSILNGTAEIVFDDLLLVASSAIRGLLKAPEGYAVLAGDYSSIEARVLAWLADDEDFLDLVRSGKDPYIDQAASTLKKQEADVTDRDRLIYGKIPVLALGFYGGVGAYKRIASIYGVEGLPEDMVKEIVSGFREKRKNVVEFWHMLHAAAWDAVLYPGRRQEAGRVSFLVSEYKGARWLEMLLPSGRRLMYFNPRIEDVVFPGWKPRNAICYDGIDQYTGKWCRIDTHGGKLSGNATQATARDVMTDAIPRLEQAGYQMLMTVHDELVTLCRAEQAGQARKEVENLLTRSSAWSQGIPLGVKISISERYQK